jgi:hypothetical protein
MPVVRLVSVFILMTLGSFTDFTNFTDRSTNASLLMRVDLLRRIGFFTGINDLLAETACSLDVHGKHDAQPGVSTESLKQRYPGELAVRRRRRECDVPA